MPSSTTSRRLRIYGHRGSRRRALENTPESFTAALGEGADGIETDVRRLADGALVLFHDDEIGGTPVELFTFSELSVAWPGVVEPRRNNRGKPPPAPGRQLKTTGV